MTLYEKFQTLKLDLSQLGLENSRENEETRYFCTPKGAQVIGREGVDGIHYCFVKGFGETVFAVSPMNAPGEYVHPLARNFEDFLRLLLACGGTAAIEQAWMWNRGEFDAFLATNPPDSEQRVVLDTLRDALSLSPMEDPYGYIRELQASFDYAKIPYTREYYDLVSDAPEAQEPPERPEWRVYFDGGFGSRHRGRDRPGQEVTINKTFPWGGKVWHIPAAYICGKGLVLDLCVEDNAEPSAPLEYEPTLSMNGKTLRRRHGFGARWIPLSRRPVEERKMRQEDWEALWLMEHYGLDSERGWLFWRDFFPWTTKTKPVLKTLALSLEARPVPVEGPPFTVRGAVDCVPFTHPVTGKAHTLTVAEYETQSLDLSCLADGCEYPNRCVSMSYTVEPELPREELTVRDCAPGDGPRANSRGVSSADGPAACSVGIIGGADGPTVIVFANGKSDCSRSAVSALYFEVPETVRWRMVFFRKPAEPVEIDLI